MRLLALWMAVVSVMQAAGITPFTARGSAPKPLFVDQALSTRAVEFRGPELHADTHLHYIEAQTAHAAASSREGILSDLSLGLISPFQAAVGFMRLGLDPGLIDAFVNQRTVIVGMAKDSEETVFPGSVRGIYEELLKTQEPITGEDLAARLDRAAARAVWNLRALDLLGHGGIPIVRWNPPGRLPHGVRRRYFLTPTGRAAAAELAPLLGRLPVMRLYRQDVENIRLEVQQLLQRHRQDSSTDETLSHDAPAGLPALPPNVAAIAARLDAALRSGGPALRLSELPEEINSEGETVCAVRLRTHTPSSEVYTIHSLDRGFLRLVQWEEEESETRAVVGFHLNARGEIDDRTNPDVWFLFYTSGDVTRLRIHRVDGMIVDIALDWTSIRYRSLSGRESFQVAVDQLRFPRPLWLDQEGSELSNHLELRPDETQGLFEYLRRRGVPAMGTTVAGSMYYLPQEHLNGGRGTALEVFSDYPTASRSNLIMTRENPSKDGAPAPSIVLFKDPQLGSDFYWVISQNGSADIVQPHVSDGGSYIHLTDAPAYRDFFAQLARPFAGNIVKPGPFPVGLHQLGFYLNFAQPMMQVRRPTEVHSAEGEDTNRVFFLPLEAKSLDERLGTPNDGSVHTDQTDGSALREGLLNEGGVVLSSSLVDRLSRESLLEIRLLHTPIGSEGTSAKIFIQGRQEPVFEAITFRRYQAKDSSVHFSLPAIFYRLEEILWRSNESHRLPARYLELFPEPQWGKVTGDVSFVFPHEPDMPIQVVHNDELERRRTEPGIARVVPFDGPVLPPTTSDKLPSTILALEQALIAAVQGSVLPESLKPLRITKTQSMGAIGLHPGDGRHFYYLIPNQLVDHYAIMPTRREISAVALLGFSSPDRRGTPVAWGLFYRDGGESYLRVGGAQGVLEESRISPPKNAKNSTTYLVKYPAFQKLVEMIGKTTKTSNEKDEKGSERGSADFGFVGLLAAITTALLVTPIIAAFGAGIALHRRSSSRLMHAILYTA